jgi:broad specificity phosphatase PhoE
MAKRLLIVRHGSTAYNSKDDKANRFIGWQDDVGLSDQGKLDALKTASKLKHYQIDAVFHSDLRRSHETCLIISRELNLPATPTPYLRERNLGNFAGFTHHEIKQTRPSDYAKFLDHHDPDWNGLEGESLREVSQRFASFLRKLETTHPGQTVLLVSHAGFIHTFLRDYFGFFPKESFEEVDHSSVTVIDREPDGYRLTLYNS